MRRDVYTRRSDRRCPSRISVDCCCRRRDRSCCGRSSWPPRLSPSGESPPPPEATSYPPSGARRTSTCSNLSFCNLILVIHACKFVGGQRTNLFCKLLLPCISRLRDLGKLLKRPYVDIFFSINRHQGAKEKSYRNFYFSFNWSWLFLRDISHVRDIYILVLLNFMKKTAFENFAPSEHEYIKR